MQLQAADTADADAIDDPKLIRKLQEIKEETLPSKACRESLTLLQHGAGRFPFYDHRR